ncbi:LysR substrate-binding domain-containing protein [Aquabacterium humicola]|uniref:LysR substrate-binding domain-containing protein n=1 Tax=Aquabacterium humicola TaxID=3237377 RepID=UPI00254352AC|nr:LysR substrate-binding domain-containing protein [Rubrivivax pictus]
MTAAPHRLDPYSLHLFVRTVQAGSIARAAGREHIAASALSRRLAELERALGAPLLIRSARGVRTTDAGALVLARGEALERDLQALAREVQALSGAVAGTLRLAVNASAVIGRLPERLQALRAAFPLLQIALQERTSAEVIAACEDDRADVGIAVAPAPPPAGLQAWPFAADELLVVLPAGHALAARPRLRLAELLAHPLVGLQAGGALDGLLQERAAALGRPLALAVSVNSFDGACRMVEAGLGLTIVPASAAAAYAGSRRFVRRPLDEAWARLQLQVLARLLQPRPRAVQALIEALRDDGENG